MPDREKVIEALACRAEDNDYPCSICSYYKLDDEHAIPYCDYRGLFDDAIELLKEQEDQIKNRDESLEKAREEIKWLRGMLKEQEAVEPKTIRMNAFGHPVYACGK